jgi:2-hydroxycyclohexanecarboxyl-CoA dehydrogenase
MNFDFSGKSVAITVAGGVAHPSDFENFDEEGRKWEIALNIDGVVNCCSLAWEWAKKGGASTISARAGLFQRAKSLSVKAVSGIILVLTRWQVG